MTYLVPHVDSEIQEADSKGQVELWLHQELIRRLNALTDSLFLDTVTFHRFVYLAIEIFVDPKVYCCCPESATVDLQEHH